MPTTEEVRVALQALLDDMGVDELLVEDDDEGDDVYLEDVISFEEAGILSIDQGLVLRFSNDQEYQLTMKRSK